MNQFARARAIISGRVQGVFYRQATKDKAASLGLSGWVRNLPDGRVEWEAQGDRDAIERLIKWSHEAPPSARVDDVKVQWLEAVAAEPSSSVAFDILR